MAEARRARCVFQKESAIPRGAKKSLFSSASSAKYAMQAGQRDGSSTPHGRKIAWTLLYTVQVEEMSTHRCKVAIASGWWVVLLAMRHES